MFIIQNGGAHAQTLHRLPRVFCSVDVHVRKQQTTSSKWLDSSRIRADSKLRMNFLRHKVMSPFSLNLAISVALKQRSLYQANGEE